MGAVHLTGSAIWPGSRVLRRRRAGSLGSPGGSLMPTGCRLSQMMPVVRRGGESGGGAGYAVSRLACPERLLGGKGAGNDRGQAA